MRRLLWGLLAAALVAQPGAALALSPVTGSVLPPERAGRGQSALLVLLPSSATTA